MNRRHCNRGGLKFTVLGDDLMNRSESLAVEFASDRVGTADVGVDHAEQPNGLALFFQFFIDPGMIASEDARADDRDGDRILR